MGKGTLCVVACHTNTDLKIRSLVHSIQYLIEISDHIVIINSSEFKDNGLKEKIDMRYQHNIEYFYQDNDRFYCFSKYMNYYNLNKHIVDQYDNLILTNDSVLVTRSLRRFEDLFIPSVEMSCLLKSNEIKPHYPDFLRRYNRTGVNKLMEFYNQNMHKIKDFQSLIIFYEIDSSSIFDHHMINCLYDAEDGYDGNIHFDNEKMEHYLNNLDYPVIKIKKLQITIYENPQIKTIRKRHVMPNYFITNNRRINRRTNNLPTDFVPEIYKNLNVDLKNFSDQMLIEHFLKCGMKEGRLYKKDQQIILPNFIIEYFKKLNLVEFL